MNDRLLTLSLVVVVAVMSGVAITIHKVNDPVLQRLVEQQAEILDSQKRLEMQLTGAGAGSGVAGQVALLDKKVDMLAGALRNLPAGGAAERPSGPPPEDYTKQHTIEVGSSYVRGKKDAPVTITEFLDFQCPFCARFHPAILEVLKAYPDQVNYVLKNFPLSFHQQARPAAKAAMAAGEQGKYWEMADLLIENHGQLSEDKFKELAKQIGLNVDKFMKDYTEKDEEYDNIINDDMRLGQQVDVRGTPTFYINGRKTMSRNLAGYKREIDALLKAE